MTLSALVDTYRAYRDVCRSTVDQYRYCVLSYSRFLQREAQLTDLNPLLVNQWLEWLCDNGSKRTANSRRMEMLTLWNLAADLDLAPRPKMVRTIKFAEHRIDVLTCQQIVELRSEILKLKNKYNGYFRRDLLFTLVQATLETSLRIGDLLSIEWPWILAQHGRFEWIQAKTGRRRRVEFSQALLARIQAWHAPSGLTWPFGSRNTPSRWLSVCSSRLGFDVTFTTLRKTAITDVERQRPGTGWLFAGHASPDTTRTWYIDHTKIDVPRPRFEIDED